MKYLILFALLSGCAGSEPEETMLNDDIGEQAFNYCRCLGGLKGLAYTENPRVMSLAFECGNGTTVKANGVTSRIKLVGRTCEI